MDGYDDFLRELKERIRNAQVRAALSVNRELVLLYWQIGREIIIRQQQQGWGAKVIERLARDLKAAFPDIKGFSARNLKYMRAFAEAYPDEQIVQQLVALIPWGHNVRILDAIKDITAKLGYVQKTLENGLTPASTNCSPLYLGMGKGYLVVCKLTRPCSENVFRAFFEVKRLKTTFQSGFERFLCWLTCEQRQPMIAAQAHRNFKARSVPLLYQFLAERK